jgi:hypothetical protein
MAMMFFSSSKRRFDPARHVVAKAECAEAISISKNAAGILGSTSFKSRRSGQATSAILGKSTMDHGSARMPLAGR